MDVSSSGRYLGAHHLVLGRSQRQNNNAGLTENLYYDKLYRLDHSTLGAATNLSLLYNAANGSQGLQEAGKISGNAQLLQTLLVSCAFGN